MQEHIPNALSFFRLCTGPILFYLLTTGSYGFALLLTLIATITDFCDGYYARKHAVTSQTGNFLDPLADKVLVLSIFSGLATIRFIPWFIVTVVLARDLIITAVRLFLLWTHRELLTSPFAKSKTVLQFTAIYWSLSALALYPALGTTTIYKLLFDQYVIDGVMLLMVGITVLSGLDYIYQMISDYWFEYRLNNGYIGTSRRRSVSRSRSTRSTSASQTSRTSRSSGSRSRSRFSRSSTNKSTRRRSR